MCISDQHLGSFICRDKATFDIHPFRLNNGSFSVTAGISLSPFLEATIAFGLGTGMTPILLFHPLCIDDVSMSRGSSARLYLNTPHIGGTATIATSVNRDCLPLGPNDFETFKDALTFGAGLNISVEGNCSGSHFALGDKIFLTKGFPFGDLPTLDKPKCMVFAADSTAEAASGANANIAGLLPAPTGTLLAASAAIPSFNIPGIESYYSAHGTLPTSVNYTQMLMATTVPDDIKGAVEQAAAP
jgi:hypothetical protein